jgi:catechol 2,3-dioxygenase-like lactoylglutathione lyase family enzyme
MAAMKDLLIALVVVLALPAWSTHGRTPSVDDTDSQEAPRMHLGHFSVSLAVKDLAASRAFYEKLGFEATFGETEQNWLILQNGDATIGLFQGMFDRNMLTFNPGWDARAERLEEFTDVREIQRHLKEQGLELTMAADESTTGPASLMLVDPDGNPILLDQHVE